MKMTFIHKLTNLLKIFGYKKDGKLTKLIWYCFSISIVTILASIAFTIAHGAYKQATVRYNNVKCLEANGGFYVSRTIGYISDCDGGNNGYLFDKLTGEKVLTGIKWIAMPEGNDSLVCYSDGKLRGYFNAKNGKVVIPPTFRHAWIFSDGLAAIEDDGKVKFINASGTVVINNGMTCDVTSGNYVFHGGYLVVSSDDGEKKGLIDKTGQLILPMEYDSVEKADYSDFWVVRKDKKSTIYDKNMNVLIPLVDGYAYFSDNCIGVTMSDRTMRKYDYTGRLINDFYIYEVTQLTYNTDELIYAKEESSEEPGIFEHNASYKTKVARLRSYSAGYSYEGLITADGHIVTMPLYEHIEAIGPDTYICTVSDNDKVIVNGKGEIVR